MIRIENDPFKMILRIVRNRYPKVRARVRFVGSEAPRDLKLGRTIFPENPRFIPIIEIRARLPIFGAMDVLAHELAHVVCGPNETPHGPKWRKTYAWIYREYCKAVRG